MRSEAARLSNPTRSRLANSPRSMHQRPPAEVRELVEHDACGGGHRRCRRADWSGNWRDQLGGNDVIAKRPEAFIATGDEVGAVAAVVLAAAEAPRARIDDHRLGTLVRRNPFEIAVGPRQFDRAAAESGTLEERYPRLRQGRAWWAAGRRPRRRPPAPRQRGCSAFRRARCTHRDSAARRYPKRPIRCRRPTRRCARRSTLRWN